MSYEETLRRVGAFGKYQKLLIVAMILAKIPASVHFISQVFVAAKTDHWCVVPDSPVGNCSMLEPEALSECHEEQKRESIPYEIDDDGNEVYSSCERYVLDDGSRPNSTDVIPCDAGWHFDHSRYKSTINEDFSLVCDRRNLPNIAQSIWFTGILVGSLFWGSVSDWFGRKKAFILCIVMGAASAIVTALVPSYEAYTAMRFITGACAFGVLLTTYLMTSEMMDSKKRVMVNIILMISFSFGYLLLTLLAFLFREWRHLQLAFSLPFSLALITIFFVSESPRWLITKGRFKEAVKILKWIAKVNGTEAPENLEQELSETKEHATKPTRLPFTQLDLIRTPNIRKKTLILFFNWFVANMVYYGLSLSTSSLGIDDYLAAFASAAVEIPGYLFCWYAMERFGRRLTLAGFYSSSGLFCLITVFIPPGGARAAVAMAGKFSINAAFGHIYIYSQELYPTVVRGIGVGMCSTVSRISGILCPMILLLGDYWSPLPFLIFGGSSVVAGLLTLVLPETKGCPLPDTIKDGESFGKDDSCCSWFRSGNRGEVKNEPPAPRKDYMELPTLEKPLAV